MVGGYLCFMSGYVSNNEKWFWHNGVQFFIVQRNVGFDPNDGQWNAEQVGETYWTSYGVLRRKRRGKFLGTYRTFDDAMKAVEAAEPMPLIDAPV